MRIRSFLYSVSHGLIEYPNKNRLCSFDLTKGDRFVYIAHPQKLLPQAGIMLYLDGQMEIMPNTLYRRGIASTPALLHAHGLTPNTISVFIPS